MDPETLSVIRMIWFLGSLVERLIQNSHFKSCIVLHRVSELLEIYGHCSRNYCTILSGELAHQITNSKIIANLHL